MYRYIPLLDIITESILTEKLKPYKLVIKRKYVYGQYGSYMSVIKAKEKKKKRKTLSLSIYSLCLLGREKLMKIANRSLIVHVFVCLFVCFHIEGVTSKKCTKKVWCTCKAVVLLIETIGFWRCRFRRHRGCLSFLITYSKQKDACYTKLCYKLSDERPLVIVTDLYTVQ